MFDNLLEQLIGLTKMVYNYSGLIVTQQPPSRGDGCMGQAWREEYQASVPSPGNSLPGS